MLSFATEFPVEHTHTSADFLRAIQAWVLGSPHTRLTLDDLGGLLSPRGCSLKKGPERVHMLRVAPSDHETAGVKYTRRDNGLEWVTRIVFSRGRLDSWVAIRVLCES